MSLYSTDTLIIGGGVAGLLSALKLASDHRVSLVMKSSWQNSSSYMAQGGIASVFSETDSKAQHISDTLQAGDGLCHSEVVRFVVDEGPEVVEDLLEYGVPFSRTEGGQFHLTKEGGHCQRRVLHVSDETGPALINTLVAAVKNQPNIELFEGYLAVDLITTDKVAPSFFGNQCLGAYVMDQQSGAISPFKAKQTVICTGGHGRAYLYSSNPPSATGDGLAMAWRAGARIANLEFMQFHPTCLYHPLKKNFLISEAVRGEGAKILSKDGSDFIAASGGSLALRDVLSRQIYMQLKASGENHVWLDISEVARSKWQSHFVQIASVCEGLGIHVLAAEPIPVVPCAHYSCGGVVIDHYGRTSLGGLYAAGEVACSGLHGGNRLASNSLLEAMVFARRLREAITTSSQPGFAGSLPQWDGAVGFGSSSVAATEGYVGGGDERGVLNHTWDEIRRIMWNYVGIVRTTKRLKRGLAKITAIQSELDEYYWHSQLSPALCEVRNISVVAYLTVLCALKRRESRGCHHTSDYPDKLPNALDTLIS